MARGRRGGSPPDLRGTLGTLLRSTFQQMGMVKDAALRQAGAQRVWIDGALLQRKHKDALAILGAMVYDRILSGDLPGLEDQPDIGDAVRLIDELELRMEEAAERTRERASRVRAGASRAASGFAARAGIDSPGTAQEQAREVRVWRPVTPSKLDEAPFDDPVPGTEDDGTVSALGGAAPALAGRGRPRPKRVARGAGGIQFVKDAPVDDDDDLAEYMHPDDVPDDVADDVPEDLADEPDDGSSRG